jgi:hypothetical protein
MASDVMPPAWFQAAGFVVDMGMTNRGVICVICVICAMVLHVKDL